MQCSIHEPSTGMRMRTDSHAHAQGIAATRGRPNPHLYQSIAVLAGEVGLVDEARQWFREGTRALTGRQSHALWHGWAVLEAAKVRCLTRVSASLNPAHSVLFCHHASWCHRRWLGSRVLCSRHIMRPTARAPCSLCEVRVWKRIDARALTPVAPNVVLPDRCEGRAVST